MLDDEGRFKPHSAPSFDDLKVAAALVPRGNRASFFREQNTPGMACGRSSAHPAACENYLPYSLSMCLHSRCGGGVYAAKNPDGYRIKAA